MINRIRNLFNAHFDEEMISVRNIILETPRKRIAAGTYSELMAECDKIFIERLAKYPNALKLEFWKTHFELVSFNNFPEINGHLLDFGCGSGHLDLLLAQRGMTITGIDASPIAIKIANYYKYRANEEVSSRLQFIENDITKTNTQNLKFDSVWSTQVFEHLSNPKEIIAGVKQYVKDDAYYLICVPLGNAYEDPGHINHFYSEKEFFDFLSPCISIRKIIIDQANSVIRSLCQF